MWGSRKTWPIKDRKNPSIETDPKMIQMIQWGDECLKNYKDIPYFQKSKGNHEHVEERENGSYKT